MILVAVGYYCRFSLSYRDIAEILNEQGVSVHPTTIMRWAHKYGNLIYQIWKRKSKTAQSSWHLDETYIKVKGKCCYLYRAMDADGRTLDFQLRQTRDHKAAYAFMKKLVKHFGEPMALVTDKAPALLCSFKKLKKNGLYNKTRHCTIKYLNNFIEQDYRHVKRRFVKSSGFQTLRHASQTIKGIETIQALYKERRSPQSNFVFSLIILFHFTTYSSNMTITIIEQYGNLL
ncbi:IS6 family transposase (plasmid) [Bacillus cereus]|nr:IS6 family transposase [Bacillus cereus]